MYHNVQPLAMKFKRPSDIQALDYLKAFTNGHKTKEPEKETQSKDKQITKEEEKDKAKTKELEKINEEVNDSKTKDKVKDVEKKKIIEEKDVKETKESISIKKKEEKTK